MGSWCEPNSQTINWLQPKSHFIRWNFGRQECQSTSFAVFGKFAILDIWSLSSQHFDAVCAGFGYIIYTQYIWITILYLLVFHPWYLHLHNSILYLVFMTNTIISVLQVYWVVPPLCLVKPVTGGGGFRVEDMEFPGVLKKWFVEFPEVNKKNRGISSGDQENIMWCGILRGLGFRP